MMPCTYIIRATRLGGLLGLTAGSRPSAHHATAIACLPGCMQVHSEIASLQAAGIEYEIVPGVSSALAAPLAAGGPLWCCCWGPACLGWLACCLFLPCAEALCRMTCSSILCRPGPFHHPPNSPLPAGFPLTHPEHSRAFAVTSAHDPSSLDWQALAVSLCVELIPATRIRVCIPRSKVIPEWQTLAGPPPIHRLMHAPFQMDASSTLSRLPAWCRKLTR